MEKRPLLGIYLTSGTILNPDLPSGSEFCESKPNYDCLTASHEIGTTLPCDDVGGRMEFVQYNRLKYDCILASALMGPATIFIVCDSIQQGDWKTAAFLAVMLLAAMACPWWGWRVMKKSVIHIDQTGLSLTRKGKLEWAFSWEEIHRVRFGSVMNHRGVLFVPKEKPMNMDVWTVLPSGDYRFHLNKTAKEALARYCPLTIEK